MIQGWLSRGYEGAVTGAALGAGITAYNSSSAGATLGVGLAAGLVGMAADAMVEDVNCKRAARTVLTGMCYSVGSATRQGSSSLTRFIGQSAMTSRT